MPRLTLLAGLLLCCGLPHAVPTVGQLQDGPNTRESLAFSPAEQGLLITERLRPRGCGSRAKACRRRSPACRRYTPRAGWPAGVLPTPDFAAASRRTSVAELAVAGTAAPGYGRLSDDGARWKTSQIFRQRPSCRSAITSVASWRSDQQGYLYRAGRKQPAADGAGDRQAAGQAGAADRRRRGAAGQSWSASRQTAGSLVLRHRNPQGLAMNPWSGAIWEARRARRR